MTDTAVRADLEQPETEYEKRKRLRTVVAASPLGTTGLKVEETPAFEEMSRLRAL